jgi:NDP-sugar pyrophosphorylase family protein
MVERWCVVLAGGLGTRLRELTHGLVPKVLAPVNGEPFLAHKLRSLAEMQITHVLLLVGELGHLVEDFVKNFRIDGLTISCLADGPILLGTGGAVTRAKPLLPQLFWVTYGDSLMYAELAAAEQRAEALQLDTIATVYRNRDTLQRSNMAVEGDILARYSKTESDSRFEWIDLGLLRFNASAFDAVSIDRPTELSEILAPLVARRQVLAWPESRRFWDINTPEALRATEVWLQERTNRQE